MTINLDIVCPSWLHTPKVIIEKAEIGPPGPPPRPGLEWKQISHRWIRPGTGEVKEQRFHSMTKVSEDEKTRILVDIRASSQKALGIKLNQPYSEGLARKANWCIDVFGEAMDYIENPVRDEDEVIHSFVYANDAGIPEVACVWSIDEENQSYKVLGVDYLAVNPKNLKESKAKNKAKGMGTAALYKVFEEAVHNKVATIMLIPIFGSGKFYDKFGFKRNTDGNYEIPISAVRMRLTEAGMLHKDTDLEDLIDLEDEFGVLVGQPDYIQKTKGVARIPGPPPGPAPRPELSWKYSTHRWIKPEKGQTRTKSGLPIPPEWTDVWISDDPEADVQARGRDAKGRSVKLTTSKHKKEASAAIFARVKVLTPHVPDLKKRFASDAETSEEAAVMYVLSITGLRIGSDQDTKATVKAYGITTLKPEHVKVSGDKVLFDYIAKKGIRLERIVDDPILAEIFRTRIQAGGVDIFDTNDRRVRSYFHSIEGMKEFEPKDFRTYVATQTALKAIKGLPIPTDKTMFAKQRMEVAKVVAKTLGNTPATSLKYYIPPEVFYDWQSSMDPIIKKSIDDDELIQDFVDTTIYAEDIPWQKYSMPNPDDEEVDTEDYEDIEKAKKTEKDSPEDPPMQGSRMGSGAPFMQDAEVSVRPSGMPPGPAPRQGLKWKPETHRWVNIFDLPKLDERTQREMIGNRTLGNPESKYAPGAENQVRYGILYALMESSKSEVWHRNDNPILSNVKSLNPLKKLAKEYPVEAKNFLLLVQTYIEAADPEANVSEEKLTRCIKLIKDNYPLVMGWTIDRLENEAANQDESEEDWIFYQPNTDEHPTRKEAVEAYAKKINELEKLESEIKAAEYGDRSSKIKLLDKLMNTAHVVEASLIPQFAGVGLLHHGADFALLNRTMIRYLDWLREEVKCYDVYTSDLMKAIAEASFEVKAFVPGQKYNPPKPKTKFYLETPDVNEVYEHWAKERLDKGDKLIVETRFNGFRTTVSKDQSKVDILFEDNDHSKVRIMQDMAKELSRIGLDYILDGETMIYQGDRPVARIHMMRLLENEVRLNPDERIVIALFDIPFLKKDISRLPLIERKRILKKFYREHLTDSKHFILSDYDVVTNKEGLVNAVKKAAKQPSSEGAMLKEAKSEYKDGKVNSWEKLKTVLELKVKVLEKKMVGASYIYTCGVLDG
jgi:DNA topoisomerase-1